MISISINWNDKWKGFKKRPTKEILLQKMKTLFAIDCSKSISGFKIYFKKLRELIQKYYCSSRGDKFYLWGDGYYYKTEKEMNRFIEEEVGQSYQSHSKYIAEIGRETKYENFEHLIIVTNGEVGEEEIKESDNKIKEYGLKYKYVSFYVIGNEGNLSVGAPYMRNSRNMTYWVKEFGCEIMNQSPNLEEIKALNGIDYIKSWNIFKSKYKYLKNAIRAKCSEGKTNLDLIHKINILKSRIFDAGSEQNEFINKCDELCKLASGKIIGNTAA